jgi:hypothetical protein
VNTNTFIAVCNDMQNVDRIKAGIAYIKNLYPNAKFEEKG